VQQRLQSYGNAFPAALAGGHGRIEQVFGHTYALSFDAHEAGVRAALLCGERLAAADAMVVVAIHVGPSLQGLIGGHGAVAWPDEGVTSAHAAVGFVDGGAGLAIARSLVDSAPRSGMVVVTERVRALTSSAQHSQWVSLGSTYVRSLQAIVATYAATFVGHPHPTVKP
jgi:hypothetical protein